MQRPAAAKGPMTWEDTASARIFRWIQAKVSFVKPIRQNRDGTERSIWPDKPGWSLPELHAQQLTRSGRKAIFNDPIAPTEGYWSEADIRVLTPDPEDRLVPTVIVLDPAVTSKQGSSDPSGITVISRSTTNRDRLYVRYSRQFILPYQGLRDILSRLIVAFDPRAILVEDNQGGDMHSELLNPLGVRVIQIHQKLRQPYRIELLLDMYLKGTVVHAMHLPELEAQQLAYPAHAAGHSDALDSCATGCLWFAEQARKRPANKPRARQVSYVG